jgi:hypothetical protein
MAARGIFYIDENLVSVRFLLDELSRGCLEDQISERGQLRPGRILSPEPNGCDSVFASRETCDTVTEGLAVPRLSSPMRGDWNEFLVRREALRKER